MARKFTLHCHNYLNQVKYGKKLKHNKEVLIWDKFNLRKLTVNWIANQNKGIFTRKSQPEIEMEIFKQPDLLEISGD